MTASGSRPRKEKSGIYAQPVTAEELERVALYFTEKLEDEISRVPVGRVLRRGGSGYRQEVALLL